MHEPSRSIFVYSNVFKILPLFIVLSALASYGQENLIPNPGFEQTTGCPGASVFLRHTENWFRLPNHNGTPDQYFGDCDYNGIINPMAPNQRPFEGQGYAGGFCFYGQYNQGEYLCVKLTRPMKKDSTYYIEFHVLPSPRYTNFIDSYGAHFTDRKPEGNGNGLKTQSQFVEHIGHTRGELIKDTINWTKISGTYKANGGEEYMILGNFRNTSNTKWESYGRDDFINIHSSYFFVDGVGVKLDDGKPFEWEENIQPNSLVIEQYPLDIPGDTISDTHRELKVVADFEAKKSPVKIALWDHLRMDHDTVNIILKGDYLFENLPIKKSKKKIKLKLPPGEYVLEVEAVNLGEVPPNTVSVKISDGIETKVFVLNSDLGVTEALRIIVK